MVGRLLHIFGKRVWMEGCTPRMDGKKPHPRNALITDLAQAPTRNRGWNTALGTSWILGTGPLRPTDTT
jgi:hypothetical protein